MKPRPQHPEIIYRPELQPRGQRTLFQLITVVAWVVWIYLLAPLLSLLAWWLGVDYFRRYMLNTNEVDVLGALLTYGIVIVIAGIIIVAWSRYNIWLAARKNRRQGAPPVTPEMLCERFRVDRATLDSLHSGKVLMMDVDDQESIRCTWIHR